MIVNIDGININYEVTGEGKSVVLLHGWGVDLETMRPVQKHLSNRFKVYLVDVVGFGKSELPSKVLNSNDFGDFVKSFLEKLNIEKPILIGHSNGGRAIINLAGRSLAELNKIILIDSAGIKPKRKLNYYFKVYSYKLAKNIFKIKPLKKYREKLLNKFGSDDYKKAPEVLRKTLSTVVNEDMKYLMPNIKVPTLLIWGENDTATPITDAKIMEKLIPNAGLVAYKNSGHYSYLENLNNFLIVLDEFLKEDY